MWWGFLNHLTCVILSYYFQLGFGWGLKLMLDGDTSSCAAAVLPAVGPKFNVHLQSFLLCCAPSFTAPILSRGALGWKQTALLGAFMPSTMWLSWHFVCDWSPQPYSAAAIFSGLSLATKTLGRKKWDMKKENKEHDWWLSLILFSATPEWMIADYLWLSLQLRSNCSFYVYLTEDICLNCPFGTNLQPPCQKTKCFSVYRKADVIILQCLLRFPCIVPMLENHPSYSLLLEHGVSVHIAMVKQPYAVC